MNEKKSYSFKELFCPKLNKNVPVRVEFDEERSENCCIGLCDEDCEFKKPLK